MYKQFGFGAILDFKTLGMNKLSQAKSNVLGLSNTVDTELTRMQKRIRTFTGLTMLGAGMTFVGASALGFMDDSIGLSRDLEDATTRLRGKMQSLTTVEFNSIVSDLRAIGRETRYTEEEVMNAADALKGLGSTAKDLTPGTEATLELATAADAVPRIAGQVLMQMRNLFNLPVDKMRSISDVLLAGRARTALTAGSLGLREYSHLIKNVAAFQASIKMKPEEMVAYGGALKGMGNSSRRAGMMLKQLGQGMAQMEFGKMDRLKELGLENAFRNPLTGARKGFNEIFTIIGKKYIELRKKVGMKEADRLIEGLLPSKASTAAFNALLKNVEDMGGFKQWQRHIWSFSAAANKGMAVGFKKRQLATHTGQLSLLEGLWASIRTTMANTWKTMKQAPLEWMVGKLAKLAAVVADNEALVGRLSKWAAYGAMFLTVAGSVTMLAGVLGLLKTFVGFGFLSTGFSALLSASGWFIAAAAAVYGLARAGIYLYRHWDRVVSIFNNVMDTLKSFYVENKKLFDIISDILLILATPLLTAINALIKAGAYIYNNWNKVVSVFSNVLDTLRSFYKENTAAIKTISKILLVLAIPSFLKLGTAAIWSATKGVMFLTGKIAVMGATVLWTAVKPFVMLIGGMMKFYWAGLKSMAMITGWIAKNVLWKGTMLAVKGVMLALEAAQLAWNAAMYANPIIAITLGIAGLIAAGWLLVKNWDSIKSWWSGLWDSMKSIVGGVMDWISNNLAKIKSEIVGFIASLVRKLPQFVIDVIPGGNSLLDWANNVESKREKGIDRGNMFTPDELNAVRSNMSDDAKLVIQSEVNVNGDVSPEQEERIKEAMKQAALEAIDERNRLDAEKRGRAQ